MIMEYIACRIHVGRVILGVTFFFFKQKTAYEVRISDWSSDVCSSDLQRQAEHRGHERVEPDFVGLCHRLLRPARGRHHAVLQRRHPCRRRRSRARRRAAGNGHPMGQRRLLQAAVVANEDVDLVRPVVHFRARTPHRGLDSAAVPGRRAIFPAAPTHAGAGGAAPAVVLPATDTRWASAGFFKPLLLPMKTWISSALSSTSANENQTVVSPLPR